MAMMSFKFKEMVSDQNPDAVLTYLTYVEERFKEVLFEMKEWLAVHEDFMEDFLPFLYEKASDKSYSAVMIKAMDLFSENMINDQLTVEQWHEFYRLSNKIFILSDVNKAKIRYVCTYKFIKPRYFRNAGRGDGLVIYEVINKRVLLYLIVVPERAKRAKERHSIIEP